MALLWNTGACGFVVDKDDGMPRSEELHDIPAQLAAAASGSGSSTTLPLMERGGAAVVSPGSMPTPAPFVMSFSPHDEGSTTSPSLFTITNSLGCVETLTAGGTSAGGGESSSTGGSASETWIRIAGILVPAIVAIGLGVGGFLVTLHVNRRGPDDQDDWRS